MRQSSAVLCCWLLACLFVGSSVAVCLFNKSHPHSTLTLIALSHVRSYKYSYMHAMVSGYGNSNRHVLSEDYSVGEVLGCGGFSVVRRATCKDDGNAFAIKSLRRHELTDFGLRRGSKGGSCHPNPNTKHNYQMGHRDQAQAQAQAQEEELFVSEVLLSNEIMVMQRIVEEVSPHPNVIHLIDVYEDASGVHLVLELCSGGELFDRIVSRERYSEAGAAAVVRQIANGLCSLHAAKIVHRDLKPENCLFLTPADDAPLKIMDFGLSHVEEVTSPVVGMFGSVDYVAPEALTRRSVLAASDMWSLGVILYILLCGYPPFHARTNREKQELILAVKLLFLLGNLNEEKGSATALHYVVCISY
ncbi:hypothetical protein O6H91_21G074500 [Diphasiastrum complanatum]|uniref:Uncharacterized protein n=1 Tax=Diphasiastrum complanatum TaxID=34168 RepID=A0ACC2AM19_DIPCM|nr:hypothetical protein O6H91_21G074500 [Diphasiastrum complanatum]